MNRHIELKFSRKHIINEKYALSTLHFRDQQTGDVFKVDFKSRQRHNDYIDVKKLWKLIRNDHIRNL